jgi:hypothetical protein
VALCIAQPHSQSHSPAGSYLHRASESTEPHAGPSQHPPCQCRCTHHSLPPRTGPQGRWCLGGHRPVAQSFHEWTHSVNLKKWFVSIRYVEGALGGENTAVHNTCYLPTWRDPYGVDFVLFPSLTPSPRKVVTSLS